MFEFTNLIKTSFPSPDASSSNEAVHLQQRLRSLSTELVTLRNRLHVSQPGGKPEKGPSSPTAPAVPPRTSLGQTLSQVNQHSSAANCHSLKATALVHQRPHNGSSRHISRGE